MSDDVVVSQWLSFTVNVRGWADADMPEFSTNLV
jgi:hypothetical protein